MISRKNRIITKLIPVVHFIFLVLMLVLGYSNFKPSNELMVISSLIAFSEFIMTYSDLMSRYIVNLSRKWPFRILSFLYALLGMVILLLIFGVENKIFNYQNSNYLLMIMFLSIFIDRFAKSLILEAIRKDNTPIHFSDIEIKDKKIIHTPSKKEFPINHYLRIDDSTIKDNDMFTIKYDNVYLIIRDMPDHATYKKVIQEMHADIMQDKIKIQAPQDVVIKLEISIKKY